MIYLVLGALVVGLVATAIGATIAVRSGLAFFRVAGAFGEAMAEPIANLEAAVARAEESAERASDTSELERALLRVRASQARLAVLITAWSDARAAFTRFLPSK